MLHFKRRLLCCLLGDNLRFRFLSFFLLFLISFTLDVLDHVVLNLVVFSLWVLNNCVEVVSLPESMMLIHYLLRLFKNSFTNQE